MRRVLIAVSLLAPLLAAPVVEAGAKKKAPAAPAVSPLENDLGKLKWGMTLEDVKSAYYDRLDTTYAAKLKETRDTIKADEYLAQKKKEKADFDASYKKFDTQADVGRYAASIVGPEIKAGVGESLILIKDEKSQRFLFFADGNFYKLVVAYDRKYLGEMSFDDFLGRISAKHGEPSKRHERENKDKVKVTIAGEWSDSSASLWAEDKRDIYDSVLLVYTNTAGRQLDHAKLLAQPKDTGKSKYAAPEGMIESLGVRGSDPAPAATTEKEPAKKETTKKEDPKKTKKTTAFDPLEGTGL
jgi:hypothetical protein